MTRFMFLASLLIVIFAFGAPVQAQMIIDKARADNGAIPLQLPYFEDQTQSNSVTQAAVQLSRFLQSGQAKPQPYVDFSGGGTYWVSVPLTNKTALQDWQLDFSPRPATNVSPVKSLTLYAPSSPDALASSTGHSLPLEIKAGETVNRFVLVETWPGIRTPLMPELKTRAHVVAETLTLSQKLGLLWLVAGAICGAGLVQFLLARQPIQAVLALNAILVGIGTFLLFQTQTLPGLEGLHPIILPLLVNATIGIGASLMLWVGAAQYSDKSSLCVLPILLNIALPAVAFFEIDWLIQTGIGLEYLPHYLLTLTGLLLLGITFGLCFAVFAVIWFFPAWLMLIAVPWLGASSPFLAVISYIVLLGGAGIASVYTYWKNMDNETASLQRRLRQELKSSKDKYKEEQENWDKKLENQRVLLNELRQREQQRSAELELAKKEADAANKAKSDFLAVISHEIRTPMNGIMGILQVIEQTPLDQKQHEYIEIIKNSGETMVTLLNDILDYSKIENGVIDLEILPFSLRKLVNSVAMLMSGRSKDKGLNVIVDIHDKSSDMLLGDAGRIRQILLNLVSNAIKFTEKGSVTIRIRPGSETGTLMFEIIDTGIGISPANQEKLFQPYAQADASINRRFGGTGLGLNICRMLVEAMKGHLGLSSIENEGSTFWFSLPLAVAGAAVTEAKKQITGEYQSPASRYVLVIDDNEINLKVVSSLLEMDGHHVVTANSGEQGLQLIDRDRFDVVLVDIMMPDMDGTAFITNLRRNPVAVRAQLPVFVLTGMADKESIANIQSQSDIRGVLIKPINRNALRQALDGLNTDTGKRVVAVQEMDSGILNTASLDELKQSLPRETLLDIFNDLIVKAQELTEALETAAKAGNHSEMGEISHNLKGMAGNFGLKLLMDHSGLIEHAIRAGENDQAVILVETSRTVLDKSLDALGKWLES